MYFLSKSIKRIYAMGKSTVECIALVLWKFSEVIENSILDVRKQLTAGEFTD